MFDREGLERIEKDISQTYLYPQDKVWVLRNLTTRQFISSDQLQGPDDAKPEWDPVRPVMEFITVLQPKRKGLWSTLLGK
jgi:hypothetical protein